MILSNNTWFILGAITWALVSWMESKLYVQPKKKVKK